MEEPARKSADGLLRRGGYGAEGHGGRLSLWTTL